MRLLFYIFFFSHFALGAQNWLAQDESIFFPPQLASKITSIRAYPNTWWNFFILDYSELPRALDEASLACQILKNNPSVKRAECLDDISGFRKIVESWAVHLPNRTTLKNPTIELNSTLAKLSLPMPRDMFDLVRRDPFNSIQELKTIAELRSLLKLQRHNGFLIDTKARKIVIPVLPTAPPQQLEFVTRTLKALNNDKTDLIWGAIGPHASGEENKTQIIADLNKVSLVSLIGLLFFTAIVTLLGFRKIAFIVPPIFAGIFLGAITTILFFGNIHGLVLSFGSAIIGLSDDYGLHAFFHKNSNKGWQSSSMGLLTTLICLFVLSFSEIPLLRQLMVFSICGFIYTFLIFYFLHYIFPNWHSEKTIDFVFPISPLGALIPALLLIFAAFGAIYLRPSLELNQFNFQGTHTKHLYQWFTKSGTHSPPLFLEDEFTTTENIINTSNNYCQWAAKTHIAVETIRNYVPTLSGQQQNLATWKAAVCSPTTRSFMKQPRYNVFLEYFNSISCDKLTPIDLSQGSIPQYAHHLSANNKWLTIWLPKNNSEAATISSSFPKATKLGDLVNSFPKILSKELAVMFPVSVALIFFILLLYYRSISYSLLTFIPFLGGIGLNSVMALIFNFSFSFVNVIGLIMLLGLSIDYGIYIVDCFIENKLSSSTNQKTTENQTTSSILFAASTTLAGFIPLLFCFHPVMLQLGQTLLFGILGTVGTAFFAIPLLIRKLIK